MEAPGAKTEAPKQPKKQDETEAPPGWNRCRQGPENRPNPDGSGRGKIPGFGGRQNPLCFLIQSVSRSGHFGPPQGRGARKGVFGGSETRRPEGRPERPPRRSATRSKSTRSSRLRSVSLSSVVSRSVLLRDVVVGKISFLRPEVGLFFFVSRGRIRQFYFDLWTFSPDPVTSSVVAIVER